MNQPTRNRYLQVMRYAAWAIAILSIVLIATLMVWHLAIPTRVVGGLSLVLEIVVPFAVLFLALAVVTLYLRRGYQRELVAHQETRQALERHSRQLELLNEAAQMASSSLDLDRVLAAVLDQVRRLLGAAVCSTWLVDEDTGQIVCQQAVGPHASAVRGWTMSLDQGLVGWVARHGQSLLVADAQADTRHFAGVDQTTGFPLRAILTVPLQVWEETIGALQVADPAPGRFSPDDLELLESLSISAATAIHNARLYARGERALAERRRAEASLQESEAHYRALFEHSLQGIVLVQGDQLLDANPALLDLTGCATLDELRSKSISEWVAPSDRAWAQDWIAQRGQGAPLESHVEFAIVRQDGQRRDVEALITPVGIGAERYALATLRDVTERKQMEHTARLNQLRLETLLAISQMTEATLPEMADYLLETAVRLTGSQFGFLGFLDAGEGDLTIHAWSDEAMAICCVPDQPLHFPIAEAGIWADAVRLRRTVVIDDYDGPHPSRKGLPAGHVPLRRLISLPVFEGDHIVAVLAVANKPEPYEEADTTQLALLVEGMWSVVRRQRAREALKTSLREKETLLQEIHHRVKNNLQIMYSLIDLQSENVRDPELLRILQDSKDRIRSMALVHETFYQSSNLSTIDMASYIQSELSYLAAVYRDSGAHVSLQAQVDEIALDIDTAIPCGLVINELVTNALKHAFPSPSPRGSALAGGSALASVPGEGRERSVVSVHLRRSDAGSLALTVRDNGVGLPEGVDPLASPSLGLQLVSILTSQLGGKLQVTRERGTTFEIVFPVPG